MCVGEHVLSSCTHYIYQIAILYFMYNLFLLTLEERALVQTKRFLTEIPEITRVFSFGKTIILSYLLPPPPRMNA